jgi:ubiquinone/menaquinone biosynthesis C-methylase UbiE
MTNTGIIEDSEIKSRHRELWAAGDYPSMVETFLLPLGARLVAACDVGPGKRVLDVAAGTGNASLPAAQRGGDVVASDLTPRLVEAGRARAEAVGVELEWTVADAEALPFADGSFEIVMSSIGVMFAPRHQVAADELVRVCRPGGTIGLLSWTPEGTVGQLSAAMGSFVPAPPPGAQPASLWGSMDHLAGLFGDRVTWSSSDTETLEVTAFARPIDFATHLANRYGPTLAARQFAVAAGRGDEFDAALAEFVERGNTGAPNRARFELEYRLAVGTLAVE